MHRFLVKLSSSSSSSNQLRSLNNQRLILPLLPCSKPFTSSSVSPPSPSIPCNRFGPRFGYPYSAELFRNLSPLSSYSRTLSNEAGRESIEYDVLIVGAGPAGLSAAIRLKQLSQEKNIDLSVCVVEKGAEVGGHIISGNVFEPLALDELLPHWRQEHAPIEIPASSDKFWFLTKDRAISLPSPFDNKGNYVISLSQLVRWLGGKAEELGTEIYPGFSASEVLYDASDRVVGIATKDMGISKDGSKKRISISFSPSVSSSIGFSCTKICAFNTQGESHYLQKDAGDHYPRK